MHLESDDATTTIDRNDADVERRRRVRPEEQPRGVAAQHVDRGHHGPEVAPEAGVHPVVDERVKHGVGHGQPVEALKNQLDFVKAAQKSLKPFF